MRLESGAMRLEAMRLESGAMRLEAGGHGSYLGSYWAIFGHLGHIGPSGAIYSTLVGTPVGTPLPVLLLSVPPVSVRTEVCDEDYCLNGTGYSNIG